MIPDFPRLTFPLDEKQVAALAKTMRQLRDLLSGKLETNENTINSIVEIGFQAPNTPSLRLDGSTKPLGVVPLAFERVSGATGSVAMTNPFQWSYANGVLTVPSLAGISGTAKYMLRILIVRG